MKLHEEYGARHGIAVPCIRYSNFSLLGRDREGWVGLTSKHRRCSNTTGEHLVQFWRPIRNKNGRFFSADAEYILEWNEYENWLFTFHTPYRFVYEEPELTLSLWELFLFVNDSALSNEGMFEQLYSTIDPEISPYDRLHNIEYISMPRNYNRYWNSLRCFFSNYGNWLKELHLL